MRSGILTAIFNLCLAVTVCSQNPVAGIPTSVKPAIIPEYNPLVSVSAAFNYAVINNRYEMRGYYKPGFNAGVVLHARQWLGIEASFTRFKRHTARSLDDIQSWAFDVNTELSMFLGETDMCFRVIAGAGYVDWKGYYIGPNLNDNYHYYFGKLLNDRFFTGNLGWGFSHSFMRQRMEGFGDFRLRFASDPKVLFSITDTAFMFGVRYGLVSKNKSRSAHGDEDRKGGGKNKPRVYKWVKDRK